MKKRKEGEENEEVEQNGRTRRVQANLWLGHLIHSRSRIRSRWRERQTDGGGIDEDGM